MWSKNRSAPAICVQTLYTTMQTPIASRLHVCTSIHENVASVSEAEIIYVNIQNALVKRKRKKQTLSNRMNQLYIRTSQKIYARHLLEL